MITLCSVALIHKTTVLQFCLSPRFCQLKSPRKRLHEMLLSGTALQNSHKLRLEYLTKRDFQFNVKQSKA